MLSTGSWFASLLMTLAEPFFFSSRRRHTRFDCDWSSDVCSSDLPDHGAAGLAYELGAALERLPSVPHVVGNQDALAGHLARIKGAQREVVVAAAEIGRASCRERV